MAAGRGVHTNAMSRENSCSLRCLIGLAEQRTYEVDYGAIGTLRYHSDWVHPSSEILCEEAMLRRGRPNGIHTAR